VEGMMEGEMCGGSVGEVMGDRGSMREEGT
jgi:hypothetical protein